MTRLNALARFCAGLDGGGQEDLCLLTWTKEWRDFAAREDHRWERFRKFEARMRSWTDGELSPRAPITRVVFYPFSGPDILYVDIFMPSASLYVMVGLEDVGFAPDEKAIHGNKLGALLDEYGQAIDEAAGLGFFRRKVLMSALTSETVKGVLPIFSVLLARMGKELVSIETGGVSEDGAFVAASEDAARPQLPKALRLRYRSPGDYAVTTLIYFSQDLSDGPLEKNRAFCTFLDKTLPHCFTYIKSASYLMHNRNFSAIRNRILSFSDAVLQDESGVLFRLFDPKFWTRTLYGSYRGPIETFKQYYQTDYCEAFLHGAKPLPFRFGYGYWPSLLWAVKKGY